jgi:hypothetical protein
MGIPDLSVLEFVREAQKSKSMVFTLVYVLSGELRLSIKDPTIMHRHHFLFATLALAAVLAVPAMAQTPHSWTQVGGLSCKVDPNVGFIVLGHQPMQCLFTPNAPVPPQVYEGAINTVGLNVGISAGSVLGWAVFAPTTGVPAGALAGEYIGVSGDIGIGLGAGANVLLGGSDRTIALQPLSVQGSVAVNVVLGVSSLKLRVDATPE